MVMNSRPVFKLSSLLCSRSGLFQKTLFGENVKDHLGELGFISKAGISTARQNFSDEGKITNLIFADYCIYKGKTSLSASPRLPKFSKLDSGNTKADHCGSIMLSFSPAIGERKYDWDKKQLFSLSATEVGTLISLGTDDSCEFFHDPAMKCSNAGQVRKTLQIKPHADGVANNILKTNERLSVPVTKAEFAVMRTAFSLSLMVHPDKCKHPQAKEAFGALAKAQQLLLDPQEREYLLSQVSSWRDFMKAGKKVKKGELRPPKLKTEDPNKSYVQRPVKRG